MPDLTTLSEGNRRAVEMARDRGWENMVWREGFSLLHWAAKAGRADLCAYFLSLKADPGARDGSALTALGYALSLV